MTKLQESAAAAAAGSVKVNKPLASGEHADTMHPTVRIIVTTHKKYRMPSDPMYLPMHVGAAIEKNTDGLEPDLGYIKDNVGCNISSRNPYFCELTGLYWAWKHIHTDYIGLVHYRRYFRGNGRAGGSGIRGDIFDKILTYRELEPMLGQYKVFVPARRYYVIETLYSHYAHSHYIEHLDKTRTIIAGRYPEYLSAFDKVMSESSGHMFNMMIMERHLLDEYCSWLFDILFALEGQVDISNYSYFQGRYCGRVGELILNVWLRYQQESGHISGDDIKVLPYLYIERINWGKKLNQFLRAKFLHEKYEVQ